MSRLICIIVFVDPGRVFEKALISVTQSLVEFFSCMQGAKLTFFWLVNVEILPATQFSIFSMKLANENSYSSPEWKF